MCARAYVRVRVDVGVGVLPTQGAWGVSKWQTLCAICTSRSLHLLSLCDAAWDTMTR